MLVHARGRRHAALDALAQQVRAVPDRLHVVHRQVCREATAGLAKTRLRLKHASDRTNPEPKLI